MAEAAAHDPGILYECLLLIQFPINVLGKQKKMVQALRPLSPQWKAQVEFLVPGFGLT